MQVSDFELIKSIDFGQDWHETLSSEEPLPGQNIREFHHIDEPEAVMRLFYRGGPLGKHSAEAFVSVLHSAPHELTEPERKAVCTVIRSASEPDWFKIERLQTTDWNGKSALELQGLWIEAESTFLGFYVCSEESQQNVWEFHYFAPRSKFEKYLPDAKKALDSVEWR